jgi:hypothetical protein
MFTGLHPIQLTRPSKEPTRPSKEPNSKEPKKKGKKRSSRHLYQETSYLALSHTEIRTVHVYTNDNIAAAQALGFKEKIKAKGSMGPEILQVLRGHQEGPLLIYAHFMEPHHPYGDKSAQPLPRYEGYVSDVALVDRQLQEIREYVASSNKRARTIVIVSADHGEAFGEHGFNYHSKTLYEEMVRVPLLIEAPGASPREVATPVSIIDLAPTVLDLYGLPIPGHLMGESLVGFLRGGNETPSRPIVLQNARGLFGLVFPDGHKIIYDRRRRLGELYDLDADPSEQRNLLEDPATSKYLGTLVRFFNAHTKDPLTGLNPIVRYWRKRQKP